MPFLETTDARWHAMGRLAEADMYHMPGYAELDAEQTGGKAVAWYYGGKGTECLIPFIARPVRVGVKRSGAGEGTGAGSGIGACKGTGTGTSTGTGTGAGTDTDPRIGVGTGKVTSRGSTAFADLVSPYGYPGMLCNRRLDAEEAAGVISRFQWEAAENNYVTSFIRLNPFFNDWPQLNLTGTETKGVNNGNGSGNVNVNGKFRYVTYGHTLSLDLRAYGEGAVRFSENHRRNLKHLGLFGYKAVVNDWSHLSLFLRAYTETMQRRQARRYYYFPERYFEKLHAMAPGHLLLVSVLSPAGEYVSGGLFTVFGRIMQYHLGATIDHAVRMSPSKLMIRTAIEAGMEAGAEVLHLGGGLGADNTDGIYRFKEGFSQNKHPYRCLQITHLPTVYEQLMKTCSGAEGKNSYFPEYRKSYV